MPKPAQLQAEKQTLTPIADFANAWGVTEKTVSNWCAFTYQAFEIMLPTSGAYPDWAIALLTICAKHVSQNAHLYFAETGETHRLKGTQYTDKIRKLRQQGHFREFQKFQKFQNFQPTESPEELEDQLFGELGEITRRIDNELSQTQDAIEAYEDQQIAKLEKFMGDGQRRRMAKLLRSIQTMPEETASVEAAIEVAYTRIDAVEIPEFLELPQG